MIRRFALAAALMGTALSATTAQAATVSSGDRFAYTAAAGETNRVAVTRTDAGFLVDDLTTNADGAQVPLTVGAGCVPLGLDTALCSAAGGFALISGGDGHDTLTAINQSAADQRYEISGGDGNDDLQGSTGFDIIDGDAGRDKLRGLGTDDVLRGGHGDDDLDGGAGNDRLEGGAGSDELDGGAGTDTASWYLETAPVRVTLDEVRNDGVNGEDWDLEIERVEGGAGSDVLRAGATPAFLDGLGGDDTLSGSGGADILMGGSGVDTADGGAGDDRLFGGAAGDRLSGGAGDDAIYADQGDDLLDGGPGADRLEGSADDDQLLGGDGDDTLLAGYGDDLLDGGSGADAQRGDAGADTVTYAGRVVAVTVTLAAVASPLGDDGAAGENDDTTGIETVLGGAGADRITGTSAAETLFGGAGDDVLTALDGADRLVGGEGSDAVDAGAGDDVLDLVDRARDTGACGSGADRADVDPRDKITGCEAVTKVS